MRQYPRKLNLVMGGGGVKGIAYIGAFEAMKKRGYIPGGIAGVSAGALAGSLAAAGYDSAGMWDAMDKFDFEKIQVDQLKAKVPAIKRFEEYAKALKTPDMEALAGFLYQERRARNAVGARVPEDSRRGSLLSNIVTFCKEGCLFDGDLLEQWVSETLAEKGVRTFADLRGGAGDEENPRGYLLRMTGVDCTRMKVVTLPDDMEFYGVDPDAFEVARAVRISTSVPFAFKPVEILKREDGRVKAYSLVDGGVLDPFPYWLVKRADMSVAGFRLNAGENKLLSLNTPLAILKGLVSAVHSIGVPGNDATAPDYGIPIGKIDTTKVYFLDFGLGDNDKRYLYNAGKSTALDLFSRPPFRVRSGYRAVRPLGRPYRRR